MLISLNKLFKVETAYWSTSRGYYFEPIQGYPYNYDWDYSTDFDYSNPCNSLYLTKYNIPVGEYYRNTIKGNATYTYLQNIDGQFYISPNIFNQAQIYYKAHTHPRNSLPSDSDFRYSKVFGIGGVVYGWNGVVYRYRNCMLW